MPSSPFDLNSDSPLPVATRTDIPYVTIPLSLYERMAKAYYGSPATPPQAAPAPRVIPDDDEIRVDPNGELMAMMLRDANPLGLELGGVAARDAKRLANKLNPPTSSTGSPSEKEPKRARTRANPQ